MFMKIEQQLNLDLPLAQRLSAVFFGRLAKKGLRAALLAVFCCSAQAAEEPSEEISPPPDAQWSFFRQYVPEKREYSLELGAMWEQQNLYWLGGDLGFHLGRCIFSPSESCQQYLDLTGGAGGRDGLTTGLLLAGLRWQFVRFPQPISPHVALFAGYMNIRGTGRDEQAASYAIDFGLTAPVHEKLDLKWTVRVGEGSELWSQCFVSLSFKMDRIVDYYVQKVKSLGESAVEATGGAIKSTIEAPGKFKDWINKDDSSPTPEK